MANITVPHKRLTQDPPHHGWGLWRQWVVANATGELVGLGSSALLGFGVVTFINPETLVGAFIMAAVMIFLGAFLEGAVVGLVQWRVLRQVLKDLKLQTWASASIVGAGIAWTLGMIPSTVMAINSDGNNVSPPTEMSDMVMYGLAALMGLVLGPILGIPQWRVLRHHVSRAGWWVPANAVAWAAGMPLIFVGMGFIPAEGIGITAVLVLLSTLLATGALVGAIHGFVLIWLFANGQKGGK